MQKKGILNICSIYTNKVTCHILIYRSPVGYTKYNNKYSNEKRIQKCKTYLNELKKKEMFFFCRVERQREPGIKREQGRCESVTRNIR